ncbi:hypothetical protein [Streptomyces sp. bgisy034]|uniref:hypothetical protein n=1 Tax=Streptomyces sp. bgisy034 TaxID=3413774 RepID=UPI003EB6D989
MSVTMRHPDLPDQPITVREDAVPTYQASGWQVSEDAPTKPKAKPAARRRRQTGDES